MIPDKPFMSGSILAGIAGASFISGVIVSSMAPDVLPMDLAGEPAYLSELKRTGARITVVNSEELTALGLQGWEIQRQGDRLFAYSIPGSKGVVVGGELYDGAGKRVGNEIEVSHQRQQLSFHDFQNLATWITLDHEGEIENPQAYLLLDPASIDAQQGYEELARLDVDFSKLWVAPFPSSNNHNSMPVSTAIYESDYRTPEGASQIITDRRGGDLGFTHHSYESLIASLKGDSLQPKAPYNHPAEIQAIQSITSVIYLMDRLAIPENSVLVEKKGEAQGLSWEIYPLLPVSDWLDPLGHGSGSPQ